MTRPNQERAVVQDLGDGDVNKVTLMGKGKKEDHTVTRRRKPHLKVEMQSRRLQDSFQFSEPVRPCYVIIDTEKGDAETLRDLLVLRGSPNQGQAEENL